MLSKCLNIACSARFLYLHDGKLFKLETPKAPGARHAEYFWLCERCAEVLTVVTENGVVTTRPRRLLLPPAVVEEEVAVLPLT
jgi:hypothetical protein